MTTQEEIRTLVRERYGAIARQATSCCAPASCGCGPEMAPDGLNVIGDAYAGVEGRHADADLNLGCGVPTRHAALRPGETVLDLGSGAGNDAFIARHEVGAGGPRDRGRHDTGDDRQGAPERRRDRLRQCRVPAGPDRAPAGRGRQHRHRHQQLRAEPAAGQGSGLHRDFRVLRPGGRFCVSDIVSTGALPLPVREAAGLYVGCVAGALPETDYLALIDAAGFASVRVAEAKVIELPDEALAPYMEAGEIAAFRASALGSGASPCSGRSRHSASRHVSVTSDG